MHQPRFLPHNPPPSTQLRHADDTPCTPPSPPPQVFSGAYGRIPRMQLRLAAQKAELVARNPVAFSEGAALDHEAEYRALAERANLRLRELQGLGDRISLRDFAASLQKLRSSRPFFLGPNVKHEVSAAGCPGSEPAPCVRRERASR
jgi:hypothetical protein